MKLTEEKRYWIFACGYFETRLKVLRKCITLAVSVLLSSTFSQRTLVDSKLVLNQSDFH